HPDQPGASQGGRTLYAAPCDGRLLGARVHDLRPPLQEMTLFGLVTVSGDEVRHFLNATRSLRSARYVAGVFLRHLRDVLRHGRGMRLTNGNALAARLARSLFDLDIPLWLNAPVVSLTRQGARTTGAVVHREGRDITLEARRGVVLACGGFPHDAARQQQLFPHVRRGGAHHSPAPAGNTGDGLTLGEGAGGRVDANLAHPAAWAVFSRVPRRNGSIGVYPHFIDRAKPGMIAIDSRGQRFVNESASYHDVIAAALRSAAPDGRGLYLLCDHRAIRQYGLGFVKPFPMPMGRDLRTGYLRRGRTLAELATQIGVDPAQLQATGAATYTWSPATGLSCSGCPNPIANPAATSTYTVTGTSLDGCISTSQVTVTVNPIPTVVPGANQTICSGSSAQLNASGTQNYSWTPATGLSCTNCPNPTASPVSTTVYTVTGTDANGCSDTAQITITVNPLPGVNAGQDVAICRLDEVQLLASGAVSYSWTPAVSLSCNTCENPMASPAATTIYQVTGTDANGCSSTDAVTVTLFPDAQINAGADQIICAGSSVQLNASGAVNYIWSPVTGLSCTGCPDPFASPSTDITYFVSGTDINGCNDSDFVKITVIQKEPMSFGPDQAICEGGSVQLNASGGDSYQWVPATGLNNTQISGPVATPTTTVEYTVIIKQGICFADSGKVRVEVYPLPTVHAGGDQTVLAGSSVNLFAMTTHTDNYLWSPVDDLSCSSCQSPVATPKRTTTYTVNVSNNFGCEAKDDVTIFIKCDNSQVFMANTFTPNSDGANDRFFPQGKGLSNIQRFRVFNRWGEIVFDASNIEVNNATQGWDGTFKGEPLKPDVFVYIVDATCETGEPMQIKGDISLIR
ncbi:MAG: FAD-binding protein, partial [Sphingobacteriales bacterium]